MKTREERLKEQNKLLELREEVEKELMKIEGVFGVGVGVREKNGKTTQELCFRIYVNEKKLKSELKPEEIIPKEIKGIKTDVIVKSDPELIEDSSKYRPLLGGIQIGNNKSYSIGTMGCLAELKSDQSVVLLSNHHVLFAGTGGVGDKVGQPTHSSCCCCTCDEIGEILKGTDDADVDAAIAKITTKEGVMNEIKEIGWISGSAPAVYDERVRKRGRTTLLTIGKVIDVAKPIGGKVNQIEIEPLPAYPRFAFSGDSGSVVVNDDDQVVGLLYAIDTATKTKGYACHIDKVETKMGIKVIAAGTVKSTPAYTMESVELTKTEEQKIFELLEEEIKQYKSGQTLLEVIYKFRHEIITLINTNKEVKVAWNKYQGPTFVASLLRNVKGKNYKIPKQVNNKRIENLLLRMRAVLESNGSKKLVGAIEKYAIHILNIAFTCDDLNDLKAFLKRIDKNTLIAEPD